MIRFSVVGSNDVLQLSSYRLVVAGFTARDPADVARHVAELCEIGVAAPATIPAFYELDPALVSTDSTASVGSANSSGEAEPVLVRHSSRLYLGVGSDHTDRALEQTSISDAKAVCPKPVAHEVMELSTVEDCWHVGVLTCTVDGEIYQEGHLGQLRDPRDLLERLADAAGDSGEDLLMFMGTVPLTGSKGFRYGTEWSVGLRFPNGSALTHSYTAIRG